MLYYFIYRTTNVFSQTDFLNFFVEKRDFVYNPVNGANGRDKLIIKLFVILKPQLMT